MNRTLKFVSVFAVLLAFSGARAEESKASSETKLKIEDVNPEKNKAPGEDVDEVITNKKMRADAGSKSKLSIATVWNYRGGTIQKPLDESRPNITQGSNNTAKAYLSADINLKYSFDQRHSIFAGVGARWLTPLYGSSVPDGFDRKFDANDPSISFRYLYKVSKLQNSMSIGPMFWTSQDNRASGYFIDYVIANNSMYEIGTSGVSVGVSVSGVFSTFDRSIDADGNSLTPNQTDYRVGAAPIFEYQINDRFNFRTLFGAYFEHRRYTPASDFVKNKVYQSAGLGISVTRDIYLYPNVQFIPDELRPEQTNVALSANLNIF